MNNKRVEDYDLPSYGDKLVKTYIEPIWYLLLKCKVFIKAVLSSSTTIGVQETKKSRKMAARIIKPR